MDTEYNSKLISELYLATEEETILEILDEMSETKNPIFLYPIYEAYKKHKDAFYSHYFLSSLGELNTDELIPIAINIGEDQDTSNKDLGYVVDIFKKKKYYKENAINIALTNLSLFIDQGGDIYDLNTIVPYLEEAGLISKIEGYLKSIYTDDKFNINTRRYALGKWFEINPKKHIQCVIDDYDRIKNNENYETAVAKVVCKWKGLKIEELKKIILSKGSLRAKHIITTNQKKEKERNEKEKNLEQQIIKEKYSNADLVDQIIGLRNKINSASRLNSRIEFTIFPQNEAIGQQIKTANDEATLVKACVDLRGIIQNLNKQFENHGLEIEEIKKLLPDAEEHHFNMSINKFFLFLHSKKFKVDSSIFGLRELYQVLGLFGAHSVNEKEKLEKKLEKMCLYKYYNEENWVFLHQNFLKMYKDSLDKLLKVINESDSN